MSEREAKTKTCDECNSLYFDASSPMEALCPECSHWLYGYDRCEHEFETESQSSPGGRCRKCFWDGTVTAFVRNEMVSSGTPTDGDR